MQLLEQNVTAAQFLVKQETNTDVEMLLSISWGKALFLDMKVQNLGTQETIDLETIIKRIPLSNALNPVIDLIIAGDQLEKSYATILAMN